MSNTFFQRGTKNFVRKFFSCTPLVRACWESLYFHWQNANYFYFIKQRYTSVELSPNREEERYYNDIFFALSTCVEHTIFSRFFQIKHHLKVLLK